MIQGRLVAVGTVGELSRVKMGEETASLEDIYMRYFQET
jgi:hypothetical protein